MVRTTDGSVKERVQGDEVIAYRGSAARWARWPRFFGGGSGG
jgi:hypothetical protein